MLSGNQLTDAIRRCVNDPEKRELVEQGLGIFLSHFRLCEKCPSRFLSDPCYIDRVVFDSILFTEGADESEWPELHRIFEDICEIARETRVMRLQMVGIKELPQTQRGLA